MKSGKQKSARLKARIALEAISNRRSTAEIAARYDVDRQLVIAWTREAIRNFVKVFAKKPRRSGLRPAGRTGRSLRSMPQSYRDPPQAKAVGKVDATAKINLTVVLKPAVPYGSPGERRPGGERGLDAAAIAARHHTSSEVIGRLTRYADKHGLTVEERDAERHIVKLSGTYRQARSAFPPENLAVYRHKRREFIGRAGRLSVPAHLAKDIVAVMGFDQRPIAEPYVQGGAGVAGPYDPVDVARAYGFPADVTGHGQTIALVELGGSYDDNDVQAYFTAKGIARTGKLRSVKLEDAGDALNVEASLAAEEVQLDIDIAGSIAPGADIVVYFAPNTAGGMLAAINAATRDPATSVVSISWGSAEGRWTDADKDAIDQAIAQAEATVTFCVASGDHGSSAGSGDDTPVTHFPASSPHVLACGGTTLPKGGEEVAWQKGDNASGGGYSNHFDVPVFQSGVVFFRTRGVPDVSANADKETGYNVRINGVDVVRGGTSAAAPLWAGLVALVNEKLGTRVGFVNNRLYRNRETAFNDIVSGGNGRWNSIRGWDPVTGLGSPIGGKMVEALR